MPSTYPDSALIVLRRIFDFLPDRFVRRRKLGPFQVLMLQLLALANDNRPGLKRLLEHFVQHFGDRLPSRQPPSSGALSRARRKVDGEQVRACIDHALDAATTARAKSAAWDPAWRLIAVDCMRANLRRTKALCDEFHVPRYAATPNHYPQLMLCTAWDMVAKMPLDWVSLPCDGDERAGLKALIWRFGKRDVLVCDRNFPSAEVFTLLSTGAKFIMRMHSAGSAWKVIKQFLAAGRDDGKVVHHDERHGKIDLRVVVRTALDGKPIVLATNLSQQEMSAARVGDAYRMRWGIETAFREFKGQYGLDRLTAPNPALLEHEIAALVLFQIAVAETVAIADAEIQRRDRERGDTGELRVANRALAGECCLIVLSRMAESSPDQLRECYEQRMHSLLRYPIRRRPGRSFPRMSHTPYSKWAAKASRPR